MEDSRLYYLSAALVGRYRTEESPVKQSAAHNLKVVGSNPTPATNFEGACGNVSSFLFGFYDDPSRSASSWRLPEIVWRSLSVFTLCSQQMPNVHLKQRCNLNQRPSGSQPAERRGTKKLRRSSVANAPSNQWVWSSLPARIPFRPLDAPMACCTEVQRISSLSRCMLPLNAGCVVGMRDVTSSVILD